MSLIFNIDNWRAISFNVSSFGTLFLEMSIITDLTLNKGSSYIEQVVSSLIFNKNCLNVQTALCIPS